MPEYPWKCVDCLDSGVAGRGTQQRFCSCVEGVKLQEQVYQDAAEGLDPEVISVVGVKLKKKLT